MYWSGRWSRVLIRWEWEINTHTHKFSDYNYRLNVQSKNKIQIMLVYVGCCSLRNRLAFKVRKTRRKNEISANTKCKVLLDFLIFFGKTFFMWNFILFFVSKKTDSNQSAHESIWFVRLNTLSSMWSIDYVWWFSWFSSKSNQYTRTKLASTVNQYCTLQSNANTSQPTGTPISRM